jgi:hypothetical protein
MISGVLNGGRSMHIVVCGSHACHADQVVTGARSGEHFCANWRITKLSKVIYQQPRSQQNIEDITSSSKTYLKLTLLDCAQSCEWRSKLAQVCPLSDCSEFLHVHQLDDVKSLIRPLACSHMLSAGPRVDLCNIRRSTNSSSDFSDLRLALRSRQP